MFEGRDWFKVDGAAAEELALLQKLAPNDLPARYLDLLAYSNGGEGPLPMSPYNLCLDAASTVAETIVQKNYGQSDLQGFLIFGSNGAGEYIAYDMRGGVPWPVVSVDMVAGGDSAELIAPDFDYFHEQIGLDAEAG